MVAGRFKMELSTIKIWQLEQSVKVQPSTQTQYDPDISGSRVVWEQDGTIYVKDLSTGSCSQVYKSSDSHI